MRVRSERQLDLFTSGKPEAMAAFPDSSALTGVSVIASPENTDAYLAFLKKFEAKKTTDDCYTPPAVYDAVFRWLCRYRPDVSSRRILRPFYPGGDYARYPYAAGDVVLDNPPFSCFLKICSFYLARKVDFFLFGPLLTLINARFADKICYVILRCTLRYDNGASIATGFATNLLPPGVVLAGDLDERLLPLHERVFFRPHVYDHIQTAATLRPFVVPGEDIRLDVGHDIIGGTTTDSVGRRLFGGGVRLTDSGNAILSEAKRKWEDLRNRELDRRGQ